jgi:hypothetical protein
MRGRKKGFEDPSRRKTDDLIPLESACLARESYKVTFLSQIGNGHEVPIGKYPECTGTSTLDIEEDVDKRISELCNKQAERIHFRAGYADPSEARRAMKCDLTDVSLGRRCRPLAEEASAHTMCKGQWTALSGMSPEDGAKLNAFGVPPNRLLVGAIPRRWQTNDRQRIGSTRRGRANTGSPGLILR